MTNIYWIHRRAVTSVTIGYEGGWSKRLGLPSYQVTSRYWSERSYVDMQLPQLPVDIGHT